MEIAHRICMMSLLSLMLASPLTAESPQGRKTSHSQKAFRRLMTESFKVQGEPSPSRSASTEIPGRLRDPAIHHVQHNEVSEIPPDPSRFRIAQQSDLLDDLLKDLDSDAEKDTEEKETENEAGDTPQAPGGGAVAEDTEGAPDSETMPPGESTDQDMSAGSSEAESSVMPENAGGTPNRATPKANRRRQAGSNPLSKQTTAPLGNSTLDGSSPRGLDPEARRAAYAAQPYTLAGILDDADESDECCEREFCEAMWNCNGGRCKPWYATWMREWSRNRTVLWSGGCNKPCSPMTDWKCSYRQGQGYGNMGQPYGNSQPYPYDDSMSAPFQQPTPAGGSGGMDILPGTERMEGLPLEPQPLPDLDAQVRRARPKGAVGEPIIVADRKANETKR